MQFFSKNQVQEIVDFEQQRQDQLNQIGLVLQQARQSQNLGLEKIATELHIPLSVLSALENANLNKLPEPIFIKQLLQKYADYLHLHDQEIRAMINNFTTQSQVMAQPKTWQPFSLFRRINFNTKNLYIPYIILLLLSIKSLSSFLGSSQLSTNNNLSQLNVIETNNLENLLKSDEPEVVETVETKTQEQQSIADELVLKITIEDECWLKVVVDGKQVFMGVLGKGEQREWTAKEKLTIRAGNAGGLSFSLNDEKAKKLGELGQVEEITFELPARS
jgi:cytoskeletal protein RodZ